MARWETAVLSVNNIQREGTWVFEATAWVGDTEIYRKTLTSMFWSVPLADLSADGWELVTAQGVNALMPSWFDGVAGPISWPVQMNFFLKRPR